MPIIILPKEVSSKIAAGEVVERPVSVVKELIENSIDAKSRKIFINIEQAGKKLIEIIDDGEGIANGESDIAIQRYTTSKISSLSDLEKIHTLGFRGEALASIAAVSRFMIESRSENDETGFKIIVEGGNEIGRKSISRSVGTLIRVQDLFFNVPARLKFLKKDITERRLISLVVSRYALFYAGIRFSLVQEGKNVLLTNGNNNYREILSQMYGLDTAKSLLEVNYSDDYLQLKGFTSPLNITRSTRKEIFFFVNGRLVNDPALSSAITRGYHGLLMVGRFPITILFISISPKEVDVNVHPTKAEIRLKNSNRVFTAIQRVIRKTIVAYAPYATALPRIWNNSELLRNEESLEVDTGNSADFAQKTQSSERQKTAYLDAQETFGLPLLRLIGQLGRTYIAAEGPDGLYLIDQHAAHERILFEKIVGQGESGNPSQFLLEPIAVTLPASYLERLEQLLDIVSGIGFKLEPFGPGTYKILAVPQILSSLDPKEALMSTISDDQISPKELVEKENREKMIMRICKRLAIKGGQVLSTQEMEQLIRDLEACKNPRTCPHGRPTMIHISVDILERQFGRRGSV
ncbi:MAG: DNA mismatch repair endonuclease MutL [Anaerolineaceae bacterium]|nr:DNA mismatch repair endonuclease MutL [Anaerolineaceae bacterium]